MSACASPCEGKLTQAIDAVKLSHPGDGGILPSEIMRFSSTAVLLWVPVFAALSVGGCSAYDDGRLPMRPGGSGGTGGTAGGGTGGGGTGGECVPTGAEICNGEVDDDCDGEFNNGEAAASCTTILNATATCSSSGTCLLGECLPYFYNCDGQRSNGCETCDFCRRECAPEEDAGNDDAGAEDAAMSMPDAAVVDAGSDSGGTCTPTNGGVETCDGVDNDCDGTPDQGATCPSNCTGHTLATGVYARCNAATFGSARTTCASGSLGMHLVRIDDAAENAAVLSLATSAVWISATDSDSVASEGAWEWGDGTQFWMGGPASMGGVAVGGLYSNWGAPQPDNAGSGGEDCAEMTTGGTGTWNDLVCNSARMFICER